jgi:rhomboid protease GluP
MFRTPHLRLQLTTPRVAGSALQIAHVGISYSLSMGNDPSLPPYDVGAARGEMGSAPEILPPGHDYEPTPPRRRRPGWAVAPATYILLGINCAVFLAMLIARVSPISPDTEQLMRWGANNGYNVLYLGEWWRIFTAMFVHVGILHLATNMWCLWNLGLLAEPLMGSFGVIAVYLLTGAAGNLLSTLMSFIHLEKLGAFPAGAGASGAVFGIAGALIILLRSQSLPVPLGEVKRLRRSVIYFAVINLVIGGGISFGTDVIGKGIHIDNYAHLGGVACGLLFGLPMVPRLGAPRTLFDRRLRWAVGITVMVLVLFAYFISSFAGSGR